jgi:hypothetical protein
MSRDFQSLGSSYPVGVGKASALAEASPTGETHVN